MNLENNPNDLGEQMDVGSAPLRRRAETYRLLAAVFGTEPTAEVLDRLRHPDVVEAFESLGVNVAMELDRLEAEPGGRQGLVDEIQCEYTRVFVGPGKHVGPYESLHRDDHPAQHWGPSTAEVKRFIEHHGLSYDEEFQGMPDHISIEFQFIAMLADVEADAIERGEHEKVGQSREIQRTFYREHIVGWVPTFCDKVVECTKLEFYKSFARIAKAVVEADAAEFSTSEEP